MLYSILNPYISLPAATHVINACYQPLQTEMGINTVYF